MIKQGKELKLNLNKNMKRLGHRGLSSFLRLMPEKCLSETQTSYYLWFTITY